MKILQSYKIWIIIFTSVFTWDAFSNGLNPKDSLQSLEVADGMKAELFASEPMLLSPSSIDIDHKGRVWVAEIVNYRGHNGKRAEGDRIIILEDTDGDGIADGSKTYYQGRDIDSPHGVCVLGNKVIVSAGACGRRQGHCGRHHV